MKNYFSYRLHKYFTKFRTCTKNTSYLPVTSVLFFFLFASTASIVLTIAIKLYYPETLQGFVSTTCVVLSKDLQSKPKDFQAKVEEEEVPENSDLFYRPIFVANVTKINSTETFVSEATHKYRKNGWTEKFEEAEEVLNTYEIGQEYSCCYNLADLNQVIIGADLNSLQERFDLLLILGALLYCVALVFLGNSFAFWLCKHKAECCACMCVGLTSSEEDNLL